MILPVKRKNKDTYNVKCPKYKKYVDAFQKCQDCQWLSVRTAEEVRCRWTQNKEDIVEGRKYYDTV